MQIISIIVFFKLVMPISAIIKNGLDRLEEIFSISTLINGGILKISTKSLYKIHLP